ncbi:MAG: hypothetical protein KC621_12395 [Myxococcales bacterium]|nr:hypothetical protein [Myxococcales bacterium]
MWLSWWITGSWAAPLDPSTFSSLGAQLTCTTAISVDTDALTLTVDGGTVYTGVAAGSVAVFTFDDVDIPSSCTVTAAAGRANALALLSLGAMNVDGTIQVTPANSFRGAGGWGRNAGPGHGTSATTSGQVNCSGGGHGRAGRTVGGAVGGAAYGDLLTTLQGGSGGGTAGNGNNGGGGGALELAAAGTLTLGSPSRVLAPGDSVGGTTSQLYCVGAGAGGGILVHASAGSVAGLLDAHGGTGGSHQGGGGGGRITIIGVDPTSATLDVSVGTGGSGGGNGVVYIDADADGYTSDVDCDDLEPLANPGNTVDTCDGIDNDCDGIDNGTDTDGDGVCDLVDPCPADNPDDTDGDGICDSDDPCPTDPYDSDGDGTCDSLDPCPYDPEDDLDGDGICGDVDLCLGDNTAGDADVDGVCDAYSCVDWWDFDDSSALGRNRLVGGATLLATGSPSSVVAGRNGASVAFSGADNLESPLFPSEVPTGASPYTIEAWVLPDNTATPLGIMGWGAEVGASAGQRTALKTQDGSGATDTVALDWQGSPFAATSPVELYDGAWHHVVGVFDGTARHIYVDGQWVDSLVDGTAALTAESFQIGSAGHTDYFRGELDDVRVYDVALTAGEVMAAATDRGPCDVCYGADTSGDTDLDGVCDDSDPCPLDAADDSDGDGTCDSVDQCLGDDGAGDSDADGVCDDLDACPGIDDTVGDADGDGVCDDMACIHWWDFEDAANPSFDLVDGEALLAAAGGVTTGPGGVTGSALWLDGVNDRLAASPTSPALPGGSSPFSIEAWVKPASTSTLQGIMSWGTNSATNRRVAFRVSNPNNLKLDFSGAPFDRSASPTNLDDGAWHHVVATWDGTDRRLYADGVLLGSTNGTPNLQTDGLQIGAAFSTQYFGGGLDEVKIFDFALSDTQVERAATLARSCDFCVGDDATGDTDGDGACDDTDPCPLDDPDDTDGDGVCDSADLCAGDDATGDQDGDGVCDDLDPCPLDLADDSDGDGTCDSVDVCPYDPDNDADGDGVCGDVDLCVGNDAAGDADGDGVCDVALCVDWWDFDDDADLGRNRVPGSALLTESGAPSSVATGYHGASVDLTGADSFDASPFPSEVPTGNAVFTIEARVRPSASASGLLGIAGWGKETGAGPAERTGLQLDATNNKVVFNWVNSPFSAVSPVDLFDGSWHHVVGVHDGTARHIYVDGAWVASKTGTARLVAESFQVGSFAHVSYFDGELDDVRIYDAALTDVQVANAALDLGPCDLCSGDDATGDLDLDGVCDDLDACTGDDATGDTDADGICDDLDACTGDDASGDSDLDGICDDIDACWGDNATGDSDADGVCDDLDACPNVDDALGDLDSDGVCDDMVCTHWWDFDDPASPGFDVVDGAALMFTEGGATVVSGGVSGWALQLDGVDDRLVTAGPEPVVPGGSAPFTIEAWIRPNATISASQGVMSWGETAGSTQKRVALRVTTPNNVKLDFAGTAHNTGAGSDLDDGLWHHLAATWDGSTRRLYVDGTFRGAKGASPNLETTDVQIGSAFDGEFFDGALDEVKVYDFALSDTQVAWAATASRSCDMCSGDDSTGDADHDGLCSDVDPDDDGDGLPDADDLVVDAEVRLDTDAVPWTEGGIGSPSVIFHEASGLYVMVFETQLDTASPVAECPVGVWGLGLATSPDGTTWTDAGGSLVSPAAATVGYSAWGSSYWECVAAHPTVVDRGAGDAVVFFKSEQSSEACAGTGTPSWGCDPYTGLGRVYLQWNAGTNSFLATLPDADPVLAVGQDYGYPHALYDGGEYKVMLGRRPDVVPATGTASELTLTGSTIAAGASWATDEVFSPAPVCGSPTDAGSGTYTAFVGGRSLSGTGVTDVDVSRLVSTDFVTWVDDEPSVLSTLQGDAELRHFDALRVGTDGFLLYFSEKGSDGRNRIRTAHTSPRWPADAVESKTCVQP